MTYLEELARRVREGGVRSWRQETVVQTVTIKAVLVPERYGTDLHTAEGETFEGCVVALVQALRAMEVRPS